MEILSDFKTLTYNTISLKEADYTLIEFDNNKLVSYKNTELSNNDILNDLLECKAYATALLYLNENYKLEVGRFKDLFEGTEIKVEDYYNECNNLLNKNIEIVEEAGIPLVNIGGYKIFEGAGYILRGNGKKKIKESFNEEDLGDNVHDLPDYEFKALRFAEKYGIVDYKVEDNKMIYYETHYDNGFNEKPIKYQYIVNLDTMKSEGNGTPINESEKLTKSQVKLKIQKLKRLCMDMQKDIAQYKFGRRARVGCDYNESGDISDNRIRIKTDYIQELDPDYVTQSISDIVKSYIPEAKLDDIQIRTRNYTKYNYKTHKDTIKTEGIRTCYYIVPGTINEDGTQTSDIAPKVDQDMNKNVTTSKKKHYDILLSGLDEGLEILNKGFLKNSKGQYQRGNYILVKEGDKYLAIHKDKLTN